MGRNLHTTDENGFDYMTNTGKEEQDREAASKAEKIQRQQKCGEARRYQRGVTQASRVYAYDEAGQRYDLSDEGRAAEEARAQEEVERWCDENALISLPRIN